MLESLIDDEYGQKLTRFVPYSNNERSDKDYAPCWRLLFAAFTVKTFCAVNFSAVGLPLAQFQIVSSARCLLQGHFFGSFRRCAGLVESKVLGGFEGTCFKYFTRGEANVSTKKIWNTIELSWKCELLSVAQPKWVEST